MLFYPVILYSDESSHATTVDVDFRIGKGGVGHDVI